jgi:peptidoglycan/xylan/chitin deacetylase (PgdA/CDA1 family)
MARAWLRRMAENGSFQRALAACERLDSASPHVLRVLTYHRVDEGEPFARQMEHLARRYDVVSVARVLATLDGGPRLPSRAVLLTFDDAYRSFAEVAWPILRARGFAAALFVPTAYPDRDEPRFWWDRLEQGFARTPRRTELRTSVGTLPMASTEERARAHGLVKAHVKDQPHERALALTEEICAALEVPREAHEVLGWDELRSLARQGVVLGAHSRTHPRLDRVERPRAREEILGSVRELEHEVPGQPRVFAYPDGRFDDELVELARAAGIELAFTTRRGTNDLRASDRLRLRRMHVDSRDSAGILRAKLCFSAARLEPVTRLLDPPSPAERRAAKHAKRERRHSQLVLRSLDAALTAGLRPPGGALTRIARVARPSSSHYERVGQAVRLAQSAAPGLRARLLRSLLDTSGLPLRAARIELAGFGSGTTVFRLESDPGVAPRALKIYRRTLGREPRSLASAARRYRLRYRRLREVFGAAVVPAEFLVLHAPLRRAPALACLQPWLPGPLEDLLAHDDAALRARMAEHPELGAELRDFARKALVWRRQGCFPDLLGAGNLVATTVDGLPRLWLLDYGIFEADTPATEATRARNEALARRFEGLVAGLPASSAPDPLVRPQEGRSDARLRV